MPILTYDYISSVRQAHALRPIRMLAGPMDHVNVIQRQNAREKRNTVSIPNHQGLRKKASLQGLRIMTGRRHVG